MKKILYFIMAFTLTIGLSTFLAFAEEGEIETNTTVLEQEPAAIGEPAPANSSNEVELSTPVLKEEQEKEEEQEKSVVPALDDEKEEEVVDFEEEEEEEGDEIDEGFQSPDDNNNITVAVDIFVNDELEATDTIDSTEYPEIEYGSVPLGYMYGDYYGELSKGEAYFNGQKGYCFTFDPENITILSPTFEGPYPEDTVQLNLYYIKEKAEEIIQELGKVILDISDGTNPVADYEVTFTGKRAAETITQSARSNEEGILSTELDKSYNWGFDFNGTSYLIDEFDYYTQLSLSTNVHYNDPVIVEGNTYTMTITHYFCDEPGGTMVDNVPDNYTNLDTDPDYTFNAGDIVNVFDYVREVEGYHLGATYVQGAGAYDSSALVITDNYIVSIVYTKDPEPIPEPIYYTVTYKDGETILYSNPNCLEGSETPVYNTDTLTKSGYIFQGWNPEVAPTVTADAIYNAIWQPINSGHHDRDKDPVEPTPPPEDPIDIPEPEVPLIEEPEVIDIPEPEVPLTDLPVEEEEVEIPDEPTPLAETPVTPAATPVTQPVSNATSQAVLPQTGDMTKPWALVMFVSGAALIALGYSGRRKEN